MRADSAYDDKKVYDIIESQDPNHSPRILVPPRKNAKWNEESSDERNRNIRARNKTGKEKMGAKSGYNKRCLI